MHCLLGNLLLNYQYVPGMGHSTLKVATLT